MPYLTRWQVNSLLHFGLLCVAPVSLVAHQRSIRGYTMTGEILNYLLVAITFVVIMAVLAGCAAMGSDRLIPARKTLTHISQDGIDIVPASEPPIILSDRPDSTELERVRFATSILGYNREEVDGVLAKTIEENRRLRNQLAQLNGESGSVDTDD